MDCKEFGIDEFTSRVLHIIRSIPCGAVMTYGGIAAAAGNPSGARQVSRILHSMSQKYNLPWQRVINAGGRISLPRGGGYEEQKAMLEQEGVTFGDKDVIDLDKFRWSIGSYFDVS